MILRKLLLPTFISIFFFVTGLASGKAQTKQPDRSYSPPAEVNLERLVRRTFRRYFRNRLREELGSETFFPIGWSRDGKFAYFTEPVDEACDCYFAKLVILDLKSDKVLWKFDFQSEFMEQAVKEKTPRNLSTLWKAKAKDFSDKLNQYQIVPQSRFAVLSFPAGYKGDQLKTTLAIVENSDEESRPYGIVKKATLQLVSRKQGKKTISIISYPEAMPLDLKVLGYIKSPFEDRIAVIMMEVLRGYEGPPHTGHVKIAGAALTTGFK